MATRKQIQTELEVNPELERLLAEAKETPVTEDELREQRISFAFGNAPPSSDITRESVRRASQCIRFQEQ